MYDGAAGHVGLGPLELLGGVGGKATGGGEEGTGLAKCRLKVAAGQQVRHLGRGGTSGESEFLCSLSPIHALLG